MIDVKQICINQSYACKTVTWSVISPPASPLSTMAPGITWLILIQFSSFKACLKGLFKGYNMGLTDFLKKKTAKKTTIARFNRDSIVIQSRFNHARYISRAEKRRFTNRFQTDFLSASASVLGSASDSASASASIRPKSLNRCRFSASASGSVASLLLMWPPTHGTSRAGRPKMNYIDQLSRDAGCQPGDLAILMEDRHGWRDRIKVRENSTRWWWYIYIYYDDGDDSSL